ncbi:MAG: hypothetical protein JRC77_08170 [Deltaproteobacteria bacterium]|nr:hypothetical protein [Deltaproteobacteria bacterium]
MEIKLSIRQIVAYATLAISTTVLCACAIPLRVNDVNGDLFTSPEELEEKAGSLTAQMSVDQTFNHLELDEQLFRRLSTPEVQTWIYGHSQVQGTPEDLERFRIIMSGYAAYELPYKRIQRKGRLSLNGRVAIAKGGYDQNLTLIFNNGLLVKAIVGGNSTVDDEESNYLWSYVGGMAGKAAKGVLP